MARPGGRLVAKLIVSTVCLQALYEVRDDSEGRMAAPVAEVKRTTITFNATLPLGALYHFHAAGSSGLYCCEKPQLLQYNFAIQACHPTPPSTSNLEDVRIGVPVN